MFYQVFLSPQVKRWAIITYKHGVYELPHELPNDLRLTKMRGAQLLMMKCWPASEEKAINIMGMLMIASIKKAPGHVPPN